MHRSRMKFLTRALSASLWARTFLTSLFSWSSSWFVASVIGGGSLGAKSARGTWHFGVGGASRVDTSLHPYRLRNRSIKITSSTRVTGLECGQLSSKISCGSLGGIAQLALRFSVGFCEFIVSLPLFELLLLAFRVSAPRRSSFLSFRCASDGMVVSLYTREARARDTDGEKKINPDHFASVQKT